MAGNRKSGGSNVALVTRVRKSGGANITIVTAKRRSGGVWVDLFLSEHTVSPDGYLNSVPNGTHTFGLNSNVSGGVGPFTYSWTWASGGGGMTINLATSTTCSVDSTGTNVQNIGTIRCTVIDTGNGNLSRSGTSDISVIHGTPA